MRFLTAFLLFTSLLVAQRPVPTGAFTFQALQEVVVPMGSSFPVIPEALGLRKVASNRITNEGNFVDCIGCELYYEVRWVEEVNGVPVPGPILFPWASGWIKQQFPHGEISVLLTVIEDGLCDSLLGSECFGAACSLFWDLKISTIPGRILRLEYPEIDPVVVTSNNPYYSDDNEDYFSALPFCGGQEIHLFSVYEEADTGDVFLGALKILATCSVCEEAGN